MLVGVLKLSVKWDEGKNVGQMMKQAMVDNAREMCGSMRVKRRRTQKLYGGMMW